MEKIFYADISTFPSSQAAIEHILAAHFGIFDGKIVKTENGKPYLQNYTRLFFSVSHTKSKLFIAFSDENVGVDAEELERKCNLPTLLKKFSEVERNEIRTTDDFLTHWTVKESAVKWLGGTLAHDLKKLTFFRNALCYEHLQIPVKITIKRLDGHILSVCSERDFSDAELISLYHE